MSGRRTPSRGRAKDAVCLVSTPSPLRERRILRSTGRAWYLLAVSARIVLLVLIAVAAAGGVLAVLLTRGGDQEDRPPAAAVVTQPTPASAAIIRYRQAVGDICLTGGPPLPPNAPHTSLLPRFDGMVAALHAVEPPKMVRSSAAYWLSALDEAVKHLRRARAADAERRATEVRLELETFIVWKRRAEARAETLEIEGCAEPE